MKTILITGVSRGIGKSLAQRFLENGDFVIGTSTTGKANWNHKDLKILELNLAQPKSIKGCVKKIKELGKKIDILINNAGMVVEDEPTKPYVDVSYLRQTLEVNLIGTADFTDGIIPLINQNGHILNISSRAGSFAYGLNYPSYNYPAYKISKAALNMFTVTLASKLKDKIIVSSVHPGWVKTDMGGEDAETEPEEAAEHIFKLANSNIETGQSWFEGKKFPW
ncbi:MAG TPA: SDR family NAD(P)-dependent oxidoreductase [Candidatus Nanoarchaeia archaeon]|nr:SDR family NAD(P)-dependent oxidoreductase [Candidatus Nanoarchaeia archaeon]